MMKLLALIMSLIIVLFPGCFTAIDSRVGEVPDYGELSNAEADESTRDVYTYLCSVYKNKILSGQMESAWHGRPDREIDYIYELTGKYPAIRGLDFIGDDFEGVIERSKAWWDKGGIVTICWHCSSDFDKGYKECLESDIENWDLALTPGTAEYERLIAGMDKAAAALKELEEAGVPVLWRPFHELDGDWFWWSRGGPRNFVKLWRTMYTRFTDDWGLNNLIWVCGFQALSYAPELWYPGDGYVDIIGADSYYGGTQTLLFSRMKMLAGNRKPICFHENGTIPNIDALKLLHTDWCYFMTWHSEFLTDEKWNTKENIIKAYSNKNVVTLDKLPAFFKK
ncbi:MAG TPA: glycosyl hydrolase [Oscillospiraceae bacterium]|nr:glycosyl hydrolase [Oscillospiraceae bacterium]